MGKTVEQIAQERGHTISSIADMKKEPLSMKHFKGAEVAIEFTEPSAAFNNIKTCLQHHIPVVSGTTGWLEQKLEIDKFCKEVNGSFLHASNFSIGVNLFFHINRYVAKLMQKHPEYTPEIHEIHHTEKKDSPSGTAIKLAEGIIEERSDKKAWVLGQSAHSEQLPIEAERIPNVPGTHYVRYRSDIDSIELKHTAHSRQGFALGAVLAAEWIKSKKGVFSMQDLLGF